MAPSFFNVANSSENLVKTYHYGLIYLSYLISIVCSFAALNMVAELRNFTHHKMLLNLWRLIGAFVIGFGIWGIHSLSLLGLSVDHLPIPIMTPSALLSIPLSIFVAEVALNLLKDRFVPMVKIVCAGMLIGTLVATIHYSEMEGLQQFVEISFNPGLFFCSILIGIFGPILALLLILKKFKESIYIHEMQLKIISVFILGTSLWSVHYIGMKATIFTVKTLSASAPGFSIVPIIFFSSCLFTIILINFYLSRNKDIAQIKHELEISKSLFNNIIESSIEYSIIATDLQGKILVWNQGAVNDFGFTAAEMVNTQNINKISTLEDVQTGKSSLFLVNALKHGKSEGILTRVRKDGSSFLASVVINLRRNENLEVIGFVIISKNITKQLEFEERLIQSNKELEQFAYITSHDLKAPLRSIVSLISWIEKDRSNKLSMDSKSNCKFLTSRAERMTNFIDGILQYSRIGRTEITLSVVSVSHLIQEIIADNPLTNKFSITYPDYLPTFKTCKIQLSQVFANLISNAVKFHDKPKGHIHIDCIDYGKYYQFSVSDNGPGIEPEYHAKIFEIFQTLQPRDVIESTGIGLSIIKKIVEEQGGQVSVQSDVGQGATFSFTWLKELI